MAKNKKCCKKCSCGFTLIELLVVIAIIGILSTIVLVSLNTARTKAADVTVKADLKTIAPQAEMVYDDTGKYVTACNDAVVVKALAGAAAAGGGTGTGACDGIKTVCCNQADTTWVAQAKLKGTGSWCVDSSGKNQANANPLAAIATTCP